MDTHGRSAQITLRVIGVMWVIVGVLLGAIGTSLLKWHGFDEMPPTLGFYLGVIAVLSFQGGLDLIKSAGLI
jgi:hypothetical protein